MRARERFKIVIPLGPDEKDAALSLLGALRARGLRADVPYAERTLKAHLKHANRIGARMVALIGANERAAGTCTLRHMETGAQEEVPMAEAVRRVHEEFVRPKT